MSFLCMLHVLNVSPLHELKLRKNKQNTYLLCHSSPPIEKLEAMLLTIGICIIWATSQLRKQEAISCFFRT